MRPADAPGRCARPMRPADADAWRSRSATCRATADEPGTAMAPLGQLIRRRLRTSPRAPIWMVQAFVDPELYRAEDVPPRSKSLEAAGVPLRPLGSPHGRPRSGADRTRHTGLLSRSVSLSAQRMEAGGPGLETEFNRNMNCAATAQRQRGLCPEARTSLSPSSTTDIRREASAVWRFRLSAQLKMPFGA